MSISFSLGGRKGLQVRAAALLASSGPVLAAIESTHAIQVLWPGQWRPFARTLAVMLAL